MKKLLLLIVAVATVSLVSCKKDEAAKTENGEAAQVEQAEAAPAEAALEVPEPTGDVEADAKNVTEYLINALESIEDEESAAKVEEISKQLEETFEKYYEGKDELKAKFEEVGTKIMESPEYKERFEKATQKMQELVLKKAMEASKEAK